MTDLDRDASTGDPLALLRAADDGSPVAVDADDDAGDARAGDGSGPSDLFDDAQWDRPPLMNRVTRLLLVAILVVAGFGGGVWLQKSHDASSSDAGASSLAAAFNAAGRGTGARAGGGFGTVGAAGGAAGAGARTGGTGAAPSTSPPVVVGTVTTVSANALVVTNFAGTAVSVTVPATATVTTDGLTPLTAGQTVSVVGTKQADGTVVATALTAHAAG